jgi:hypothetical protein
MPCRRGAVDHHVERPACQKTSKQMTGNRSRGSTRFRGSLARMELATVVYMILTCTERASAGRAHGVKHGDCERKKVAQARGVRLRWQRRIHRPSEATFQPQWRRGAWYTLWQSLQTNVRALACATRFVDLDKPLVEAWGRDSLGHTSALGVCVQTHYNLRGSRQPVRYERARSSRMLGATGADAASGLEGAINALRCLACADCEIIACALVEIVAC